MPKTIDRNNQSTCHLWVKVSTSPSHLTEKKTLILDIDETMIHCLDEKDHEDEIPDVVIRIPLDDEDDYADAGINIRPHLHQILKEASQMF